MKYLVTIIKKEYDETCSVKYYSSDSIEDIEDYANLSPFDEKVNYIELENDLPKLPDLVNIEYLMVDNNNISFQDAIVTQSYLDDPETQELLYDFLEADLKDIVKNRSDKYGLLDFAITHRLKVSFTKDDKEKVYQKVDELKKYFEKVSKIQERFKRIKSCMNHTNLMEIDDIDRTLKNIEHYLKEE